MVGEEGMVRLLRKYCASIELDSLVETANTGNTSSSQTFFSYIHVRDRTNSSVLLSQAIHETESKT